MSEETKRPQYGINVREIDRQRIEFLAAMHKVRPTTMASQLLTEAARKRLLEVTENDVQVAADSGEGDV